MLWSWDICQACKAETQNQCVGDTCASRNASNLRRFFVYYKTVAATCQFSNCSSTGDMEGIHRNICTAIRILREQPASSRLEIQDSLSTRVPHEPGLTVAVEQAIRCAAKTLTMVSCLNHTPTLTLLEQGLQRRPWMQDVSLAQYLRDSFPTSTRPMLCGEDYETSQGVKGKLKATKLVKYLSVKFRPTDNLRNHLQYSPRTRVLLIFHHTAFLKENLKASRAADNDLSFEEALRL